MIIHECKHDKTYGNQDFGKSARVAALSKEERVAYEASLKAYRDNYAIAATERQLGFAEGEAKGRAEGEAKGRAEGEAKGRAEGELKEKLENARNFKLLGVDPAIIAKATGLSLEEIDKL